MRRSSVAKKKQAGDEVMAEELAAAEQYASDYRAYERSKSPEMQAMKDRLAALEQRVRVLEEGRD